MKKITAQKGFTLIELLVVVAIIAVLAVIGVAVFSGTRNSGDQARVRADVNSIAQALEQRKTCNADGSSGTAGLYCLPLAGGWFTNGTVPAAPAGYAYTSNVSTGATTGVAT